jgi:predicted NAD-dependent protein-ADP-ribosyltransferase YbiA (DUF1768 family)
MVSRNFAYFAKVMKNTIMHNRQQLITAINDEGLKPKYLFFWGHTPSPTGEVTKSCLSQWYDSPFTVDGLH